MPARRRRGGDRAACERLGAAAAQVVARTRGRAADRRWPRRGCSSAGGASASTPSSSAIPGTSTCPAARRIARGRPVLFNPLVSLHETLVEDRGRFAAGSPAAGVLRQVDRLALRRADLVVADTAQNARHLAELAELARRTAGGLLRRRRGAPLPARVAAAAGLSRALRRQADPAPRRRDDPRGGAARARDPLPRRRQRPARRAAARAARRTSSGSSGSSTSSCRRRSSARGARSASSAPRRRRAA